MMAHISAYQRRKLLSDVALFSRCAVRRPLRRYQLDVARAVTDAVDSHSGRRIAVMIARQGGKNELSDHIEAHLLLRFQRRGGFLVKAAPTFRPQLLISKMRLIDVLSAAALAWRAEHGNVIALGSARCMLLSAEPGANVVGATAHHLLEFDEAQDIALEKHDKDFSPMGATTNCTRVYWGTAWNEQTLLHRTIEQNREAEQRDGVPRNFIYPWWRVAEELPEYGRYVEAERDRLGADHPMFVTQYELKTIPGAGGFFSDAQRLQLRGDHPRRREPEHPISRRPSSSHPDCSPDRFYVAAVDIAGEDEQAEDAIMRAAKPRKDSTVLLVGELDRDDPAVESQLAGLGVAEPRVRVVEAYWWSGRRHRDLYPQLVDLLRKWGVARVAVDATGIGAAVASFLAGVLGEHICDQVVFSAQRKSELGYALLSAINGGRLKWWAADGSPEDAEFWLEVAIAKYHMRDNQLIRWGAPVTEGHDDFIVALALLVRAARAAAPPAESAVLPRRPDYQDGRY